jgi:uncharacterized protein (TIGR02266 family)
VKVQPALSTSRDDLPSAKGVAEVASGRTEPSEHRDATAHSGAEGDDPPRQESPSYSEAAYGTAASEAATIDARSLNLSVGGLFVASSCLLDPGQQVSVRVDLHDGGAPVDAPGEVVWVRQRAEGGDPAGMAVRFLALDDTSAARIGRLVARRDPAPTEQSAPIELLRRKVRVRLGGLPGRLRAVAREMSDQGVMLEAELPWLKLGEQVVTEVAPGRERLGRMRWIGIDVAPTGVARLRIAVDFADAVAAVAAPVPTPSPRRPHRSLPTIVLAEPTEAGSWDSDDELALPRPRSWPWLLFGALVLALLGGAFWLDRYASRPVSAPEQIETHNSEWVVPEAPRAVVRIIPLSRSVPSGRPAQASPPAPAEHQSEVR